MLIWISFENRNGTTKKNKPNETYGTIKTGLNREYHGDMFHGTKDIMSKINSTKCGRYNRNIYKE
jgi:hypothetical protein